MSRKKKNVVPQKSVEDCIDTINACINKRRHRWTLSSLAFLDFDDVAQNLRLHICKKWHLYDQSKKLESWLTVVINNQMINMIRNYYGNFSRPCLKCEFYEGDDICRKFDLVSTKCDLYRTWTYGKKTKHDIQLSLPIVNHENEVHGITESTVNVEATLAILHKKIKDKLDALEWTVYEGLFINHLDESEVAKKLGFKSNEKGRCPGYKQLSVIKKRILEITKEMLDNGEIDIIT